MSQLCSHCLSHLPSFMFVLEVGILLVGREDPGLAARSSVGCKGGKGYFS